MRAHRGSRLFIGLYPAGVVYADKAYEINGDYARIAFLPYDTLELEFTPGGQRSPLRDQIMDHAADLMTRTGGEIAVSASGQTRRLGTKRRGSLGVAQRRCRC